MKRVTGFVRTEKGGRCEFDFEIADDATPEEIEHEAREAAFDRVVWEYEVQK